MDRKLQKSLVNHFNESCGALLQKHFRYAQDLERDLESLRKSFGREAVETFTREHKLPLANGAATKTRGRRTSNSPSLSRRSASPGNQSQKKRRRQTREKHFKYAELKPFAVLALQEFTDGQEFLLKELAEKMKKQNGFSINSADRNYLRLILSRDINGVVNTGKKKLDDESGREVTLWRITGRVSLVVRKRLKEAS